MAFSFRQASCVAVGTFNMYIIQPTWLAQNGIIDEGIELGIDVNLGEPGRRYYSEQMDVRWTISPTRVAVETESPTADCGAYIARLLDLLEWTPIAAIGNNVRFESDRESQDELPGWVNDCVPSGLDSVTLQSRNYNFGIVSGGQVYNLQLGTGEDAAFVSSNAHTVPENRAARAAAEAARRFGEHQRESIDLMERMFKVDIRHEDADD